MIEVFVGDAGPTIGDGDASPVDFDRDRFVGRILHCVVDEVPDHAGELAMHAHDAAGQYARAIDRHLDDA